MGASVGGLIAPGVVGRAAGGVLGQAAGHIIDKISGHGDYVVTKNTFLKSAPVPSFGKGCVRIQHREFVANIASSTAFALKYWTINPGNPELCPWLANIASNFEMYKFHGLIFEYVSQAGDALSSTNTNLGKVVMATNYNVTDPNYINEQEMYATEFSNSGKPSENLIHAIECEPAENPLKLYYVATSNAIPGDARFYHMGRFQLATNASQGAFPIGELWVSYDVSLCKPSIQNSIQGLDLRAGKWTLEDYSSGGATGIFRHPGNFLARNGSNVVIDNPDENTIEFAPDITEGRFLVQMTWIGSSGATINAGTITPSLCTLVTGFYNNGAYTIMCVPTAGGTQTSMSILFAVDINAPGTSTAKLVFSGQTIPASLTNFDMVITQIPSDMSGSSS